MGKMPTSREEKPLYRSLKGEKKSGFCVGRAGHSWLWLRNDPTRTQPDPPATACGHRLLPLLVSMAI